MSNSWFDDVQPMPKRQARQPREGHAEEGTNPLFQVHPEGGGAYGGRDNALTAFVGLCRKKRLDIDAAVSWALSWNQEWCQPPLLDADVRDKVARAWVTWAEGDEPDATPDDGKIDEPKKVRFLTWEGMKKKIAELGELEWLIDKTILRRGLTFLSAPPGGGKSWAAADLVRTAASGGKWLGHFDMPKCKVMYIDEEMGCQGMFHRLDALGVEEPDILYSDLEGIRIDEPLQVKEITDLIKSEGIDIVIIDTLVRVHKLDENDNSQMSRLFPVFSQWRQSGATVVVLHHMKKGDGTGMGMMRGASDIPGQADSCYSITKSDDGLYTIKTEKSRYAGELDKVDLTYDICTENGSTAIVAVSDNTSDAGAEKDLTRLILSALEKEPLSTVKVTEVVKRRKADVVDMLAQLESEKLIEQYAGIRGAKMWRIKPKSLLDQALEDDGFEPDNWWKK